MRILLGISMLVLAAILWTGISILRHIRLTRRRNAFLRDQQNFPQSQPLPMPSLAGVTPLPARFAAPLVIHTQDAEELADVAYVESLAKIEPKPTPQPVEVLQQRKDSTPRRAIEFPAVRPASVVAQPEPAPLPMETPQVAAPAAFEPAPHVPPEPAPLRIMEFVPEIAARDLYPSAPAFPSLAAAPVEITPPPPAVAPPPPLAANQRRPVRSVHSQSSSRPAHRPDWIYFNKDMGDLSDPAPSRIRVRSR